MNSQDKDPAGNDKSQQRVRSSTAAFEETLKRNALKRAKYILRLYVSGSSARSLKALHNLRRICNEHLPDGYDLEVIDIHQDPAAAREAQIIAAPTLIKKLPKPLRRFVGDLSNTQKVLIGLDLYKRQESQDNWGGAET